MSKWSRRKFLKGLVASAAAALSVTALKKAETETQVDTESIEDLQEQGVREGSPYYLSPSPYFSTIVPQAAVAVWYTSGDVSDYQPSWICQICHSCNSFYANGNICQVCNHNLVDGTKRTIWGI